MSTAKVIFTYKRKRLSSRGGVGTSDVCPDFSADGHAGKLQVVPKERSEKDPMIFKGVSLNDADCSMDYQSCLDPSNQHVESKLQVQRSGACNSRERHDGSNKLPEDNNCKASGENGCTETIMDTSHTTKSSCSDLESSRALSDGCLEVSKRKLKAPLLTFSRRLKRKDTGNSAILGKIPAKEVGVVIRESELICAPATSCKEMLNKMRAVEKSSTLQVATDNTFTGHMLCQIREKMTSKESRDSSCLCTSSPDIPALRQTEEKRCSQDDLVVNVPSVTKQSSSVSSGLDAPKTTYIQEDAVLRSSDDEILSCCDDVCKTVEQHVSNQCRTSSGDSQLTSSDCSDVKTFAGKPMQNTASSASLDLSYPPSGALVIDCNLIPESNIQEKESDAVHHSSAETEIHGKVTEEGQIKRKDLELFRDIDLKVVDSPSSDVVCLSNDLYTPVAAGKKPETKYLQLFLEAGQNGDLASASTTTLEMGSRGAQPNGTYYSNCDMPQLKQASRKASAPIGLSLPIEPMHECETSSHSSGMRKDHNVSIREFIQNPAVQSFPDQSSLMWQQKVLLDTCNSRATALRGNRAMSLDRFEPGGPMWSEEELDSLWIGIRRHGRGNWHAMLLDPKLRFAPWRVARDLAAQWDREQCNLFTRQHMSSETRLSLGDVYAQREGGCFRGNGVNESHMNVTLAGKLGNYSGNSFSTRDGMGFDPHKYLPHWLQEPAGTSSKFFEPSSRVSAIRQAGGLKLVGPFSEPSATSCWGRNLNNLKVPGSVPGEIPPPSGGEPSKREQSREKNVIVIDSDGSSEETISDDHNSKN